MTQATYESPFPWKIHRDSRGWPRWWQRWYEAWLVVTGKYTFWHAWDNGKITGSMWEYERIVRNGGDLGPLLDAAIDELVGTVAEPARGEMRREIWSRYKAASSFPSNMRGTE